MIIRTFTAESPDAALKRMRAEMGQDAVVLKTRQVNHTGNKPEFTITACLDSVVVEKLSNAHSGDVPAHLCSEEPSVSSESGDAGDKLDERISSIDRKLNQLISLGIKPDGITRLEIFQAVHRQLKAADLPDDYLEIFISSLVENYDGAMDVMAYAREELARRLRATIALTLEFRCGDSAVFVGPAGSGKSSAMGKMAAQLSAVQKQRVRLLSLDDHKQAAFDEILNYADILGLEVIPPPAAHEKSADDDTYVTLIDSPAMPTQSDKRDVLRRKIEAAAPQYRFAVFSCLTRSRDVFEISKMLKELSPTHLILTMQDIASCLGTVVTAAWATGLKIAYLSDAPGGVGVLQVPDAEQLAGKLLNVEVTCG